MTCKYVVTDSYADKVHQAGCKPCRKAAWELHVPQSVMIGTVPGGHNEAASAQYRYQAGFDKGLDAYKAARAEGLAPKATTVSAVDAARRQVKSQERALKKMGMRKDELKTVAGVA